MCGHTLACTGAVAALYYLYKLFLTDTMPADIYQSSHNCTHHIAQKTVRSDNKMPAVCIVLHPQSSSYTA